MKKTLKKNQIVLLGIGHTNAMIVRMWKMKPIRDCDLVCVSNHPVATYSGMLPGVLAGQYERQAMEIDLVRLCNSAGCRLIVDDFSMIDRDHRTVHFSSGRQLQYDWLSIGIGSRPTMDGVSISQEAPVVPVKPMQNFLSRLRQQLERCIESGRTDVRIAVVGGGVGSIEIAACLANRFKRRNQVGPDPIDQVLGKFRSLDITIFTASNTVGQGLTAATQKRIARAMERLGIPIVASSRIAEIDSAGLVTSSGNHFPADLVLWATGATGAPELKKAGLELDPGGFILTRATLQSKSDDRVFVVGDSGTLVDNPTPKAGVYAVRQGPILRENLNRISTGKTLLEYKPQKDFLKLVNLGDGTAIGQWGNLSGKSPFLWTLKNRIDSRFMAKYQEYSPAMVSSPASPAIRDDMKCLGCGGKIGGSLLTEALSSIPFYADKSVIALGIDQPDDAAIIRAPSRSVTVTTDFFAAPVNDPWLAGRMAVMNAVSDLYVMGARPTAALSIVQVGEGHPRGQLRTLRELMLGAAEELRHGRISLAGGHTIEGERIVLGFTILGEQVTDPMQKRGLKEGDVLVLSKPIGSGTLLAALMQNKLHGSEFLSLLEYLSVNNSPALALAKSGLISAMTDVTGFGLAGHLGEMLIASDAAASIDAGSIPLLEGFDRLSSAGIRSTLADSNRDFASFLSVPENSSPVTYNMLIDPQTCGGIITGCRPENASRVLEILHQSGHRKASVIGHVVATSRERPRGSIIL